MKRVPSVRLTANGSGRMLIRVFSEDGDEDVFAGAQPSGTQLTDEEFGKKNIHHLFCKVCGIRARR